MYIKNFHYHQIVYGGKFRIEKRKNEIKENIYREKIDKECHKKNSFLYFLLIQ